MTAINHALTGALIGLTIGSPWAAIPMAFASHFICDMIPHFGSSNKNFIRTKIFKFMLIIDAFLCVLLALLLAIGNIDHWFMASLCAFVATSPDLWHIKRFIYAKQNRPYTPGKIATFSSKIQWFERPVGVVVEAIWATIAVFFLFKFS